MGKKMNDLPRTMKIPPRTGEQASALLRHWSEHGGFDIITAIQFCPLLARKALKMVEERDWLDMPLERLTELVTGLCSSPATALEMLILINKDEMPMFALTGDAFTRLNHVLETTHPV